MGGRGRGRGKSNMSISSEQLGLAKGDAPPPVLQPPPKYPPLEYKAPPFEPSLDSSSYLLMLKRDFADTLHESPNNIQLVVKKKDIERYSDRYAEIISNKLNYNHEYDWSMMPEELRPSAKRKKSTRGKAAKKLKEVDVDKVLDELVEKEAKQGSDDEEEKKKEEDDDEEKDQDENVEDEEANVDEEMDDGTDYANNYFDNGEGYDEEDDNLDDGPVY